MTDMDPSIFPLPEYKDATITDALSKGYDILQLKYDGWSARIEIAYGWVSWYSKTGRRFKQICIPDLELQAVIYGEAMFGTQWAQQPEHAEKTYCYDLASVEGKSVRDMEYRARYSLLRGIASRLPLGFIIVPTFPIAKYDEVWKTEVVTTKFEGVVFRKKTSKIHDLILRQKLVFTVDLKLIAVLPGDGKHLGKMGAVVGEAADGSRTDVGGGWSDEERASIAERPVLYIGRWFEIEARAKFESGAYRHANFIRWREDK